MALDVLLMGLTIVFFVSETLTLKPFALYSHADVSLVVLVALLVCLIDYDWRTAFGHWYCWNGSPRTAQCLGHVWACGGGGWRLRCIFLLDKTGTITIGNRMASASVPASGVTEKELAEAASLASCADLTPEGRSVVALAQRMGVKVTLPPGGGICALYR